MNKSLYYIECKCIRDCNFPNVSFKTGDVVYFNKKAASNEMYMFNRYVNVDSSVSKNAYRYRGIGAWSYLPFTSSRPIPLEYPLYMIPAFFEAPEEAYTGAPSPSVGILNLLLKKLK